MIPETDIEIGSSLSYLRHLPTGMEVEYDPRRHPRNISMAYDRMAVELEEKVTAATQGVGSTRVAEAVDAPDC